MGLEPLQRVARPLEPAIQLSGLLQVGRVPVVPMERLRKVISPMKPSIPLERLREVARPSKAVSLERVKAAVALESLKRGILEKKERKKK